MKELKKQALGKFESVPRTSLQRRASDSLCHAPRSMLFIYLEPLVTEHPLAFFSLGDYEPTNCTPSDSEEGASEMSNYLVVGPRPLHLHCLRRPPSMSAKKLSLKRE